MFQLSKPEQRRLSSANDGAIAPAAAIVLLALCMTVGLAIDYSQNLSAKTRLQSAADAAALAAVASAAQSEGTEADIESAKAMAHRIYVERLKDEAEQLQQSPSIELSQTDGSYTATVTFSVANQNVFGAFFSQATQSLNGTAVASQQSTFLDLHLMLDVSASMGLGASEDDQRRLFENTGCQFGCHVAESGTSNEQNAINLGIPMRIDVLRSATRQMMDDVEAHPARGNIRIALHAFHDTAEQLLAPTDDLDRARLTVQQLRLGMGRARAGTSPGTGRTPDSGDTQPLVMAQYLESVLHHNGHGTRGDPRKLVVIVTDGTESTWSPGLSTRPWDPETCRGIQQMGIEVAVVYLEYSFYGKEFDGTWPWAIAPIEAQIEPNLRSCATRDLYVKANDPAEVHSAFSEIFHKIVKQAEVRLTN